MTVYLIIGMRIGTRPSYYAVTRRLASRTRGYKRIGLKSQPIKFSDAEKKNK